MYGVTFESGNVKAHTFKDWGLFLSSFDIGEATPKTEYVDIVGGDGSIDLTEAYGRVFFKDRTHTIKLQNLDDDLRWSEKLDEITSFLHGRLFKITADYNPLWYYYGRVEVNKYATSKRLATITLKAVCEPYKYKQYKTIIDEDINGITEINCLNSRMVITPTFKVSNAMNFSFNNKQYSLQADTETIYPDVLLNEGSNIFVFEGEGNVNISYQEGTL